MPSRNLVEFAKAGARLDDRNLVVDVDLEDGAHLTKCDEDPARTGDAGTGKPRAGAASGDRHCVLPRDDDDLGHLSGGVREDDNVRGMPMGHQ